MKKGVFSNACISPEVNQVIHNLTTLKQHNFQTHGNTKHQIVEIANFFRELHPDRQLHEIVSIGSDQRQLSGRQINDYSDEQGQPLSVSQRMDILRVKQKP